uniref:Aminotransferase class I/classII domain-containing protein n=1 Tax=Fagus sylvatica TaxID=28930 RepID=A0A2N9FL07_FAGSY
MWVLSCASSAYPTHSLRASFKPIATVRSSSQVSVSFSTHQQQQQQQQQLLLHYHQDHPFVPEVAKAVDSLYSEFRAVDNLVARNTARVLKAFQNARVGSHHFGGSTGYGHDEAGGREALDQAFAAIVGAESAIVRSQFFSGTHAITCALFAFLRPGDELLAVAGAPYDTLEEVIGKRDSHGLGSLKDFGVNYREVPLAEDGGLDWDALVGAVKPHTRCALIQRSCGYSWRRSLSVNEIGRAIKMIKMQNSNCLVMVDNCYGEFVESIEPPMVGADLIAGSLIKNPGGTIAPCGGYVAGRERWVKAAAARLSAPGLGVDCGSTPGDIMRAFFQGLFLSPQMVGEAIKGTFLIAEVMGSEGYKVQPLPRVQRHDIVQAVELGSRERLLAFCEAVQRSSPVGSFTKPVAGTTPGYASEVIFADGTFIDGSTSELSCDGPLREPFAVYCQGGTHWTQWGLVLGELTEVELNYKVVAPSRFFGEIVQLTQRAWRLTQVNLVLV